MKNESHMGPIHTSFEKRISWKFETIGYSRLYKYAIRYIRYVRYLKLYVCYGM